MHLSVDLIIGVTNGQIEFINDLIDEQNHNPHLLHSDSQPDNPISIADIALQSEQFEVLKLLVETYNVDLSKSHFFLRICELDNPEFREKILDWLLEKNLFPALGITQDYILTIKLNNRIPLSDQHITLTDPYGLSPWHYFIKINAEYEDEITLAENPSNTARSLITKLIDLDSWDLIKLLMEAANPSDTFDIEKAQGDDKYLYDCLIKANLLSCFAEKFLADSKDFPDDFIPAYLRSTCANIIIDQVDCNDHDEPYCYNEESQKKAKKFFEKADAILDACQNHELDFIIAKAKLGKNQFFVVHVVKKLIPLFQQALSINVDENLSETDLNYKLEKLAELIFIVSNLKAPKKIQTNMQTSTLFYKVTRNYDYDHIHQAYGNILRTLANSQTFCEFAISKNPNLFCNLPQLNNQLSPVQQFIFAALSAFHTAGSIAKADAEKSWLDLFSNPTAERLAKKPRVTPN